MIPARGLAFPGVIAAMALAAGCNSLTVENPFTRPPTAVFVDANVASTPVALMSGQDVVVKLEADTTSDLGWVAIPGYEPTLVSLGGPDYVPRSQPPVVGAPADAVFRFRADKPGTTVLELAYRRPFEPNVAPARTVRYDITVR